MTPLRIVIADDHEMLRRGLRRLLEEHEGWEVVGEARNGQEAVELAQKLKPDLINFYAGSKRSGSGAADSRIST